MRILPFFITLFLLLALAGCLRPEFIPPTDNDSVTTPIAPALQTTADSQTDDSQTFPVTLPVKTVTRENDHTIHYGYDENDNLVSITTPNQNITLIYVNGTLREVRAQDQIQYHYKDGKLNQIIINEEIRPLFYDENEKLLEYQAHENVHFSYSDGQLKRARRGVAGTTSISHDHGRVSALTRGSVRIAVRYDEKDRMRVFDGGDTHFVLGYWRDNKIIKLTGNTLGQGIEVSYGPEPTPTRAQLIAEDDKTTFTSPETNILYDAVDRYLYCTYVRRLPVLFEGISYTIYTQYHNKTLQDYLVTNTLCDALP